MVRSENVLGMLMQNVFAVGLISVIRATIGFSLAFGREGSLIGNVDDVFGDGIAEVGMWPVLSYSPVAHRVWSAGGRRFEGKWILNGEVQDFAGGAAIHIDAGSGVFGDSAVNGCDRLLDGGGIDLFVDQPIGAIAVIVFSGVVTYVLAVAIDRTIGLRVDPDDEQVGLDPGQHAESAYQA